jgi:hypothetical protein
MTKKERAYREIPAAQILEWNQSETHLIQIETARDVVPGGLAMAMAPVLVNWRASSLGFGPENYYFVRNVNLFNNVINGITLLGAVRIPAVSVERVEFVEVVGKVANREADLVAHAMLRFVFKEDRRALALADQGIPGTADPHLHDLVLSWEAWRPPRTGFDPVAGLDPTKYALTQRGYAGFCRCLTDVVMNRSWRCYPLRLPDIPHIADELLYVSLLLGDAVARHTIGGILDHRIARGRDVPDDYGDPEAEGWEAVKDETRALDLPENPIQEILDGKIGYQLLLRSCVTMALTSIDWALVRVYKRAGRGDPPRIRITPNSIPGMLDELAHGHRMGALVRVPAALKWLMHHQAVVPGKSEELLDEVGLLEHDKGRIVRQHYDNRIECPYGKLSDHLMY